MNLQGIHKNEVTVIFPLDSLINSLFLNASINSLLVIFSSKLKALKRGSLSRTFIAITMQCED